MYLEHQVLKMLHYKKFTFPVSIFFSPIILLVLYYNYYLLVL